MDNPDDTSGGLAAFFNAPEGPMTEALAYAEQIGRVAFLMEHVTDEQAYAALARTVSELERELARIHYEAATAIAGDHPVPPTLTH